MSDPVPPSRRRRTRGRRTFGLRLVIWANGQHRTSETRQVTVVGAGQVQGTPDTLTVNASIEFVAPDVSGAMNQTSERQQAVIDALVGSGIDRKDISTTQVSLQPQFAGGDSTAIIGYRASNSIDVKIRKLDTASQALALIVSTGGDATRINSVNYSIEDDSQLVKDARARALQRREGPRPAVRSSCPGWTSARSSRSRESGGATPANAAARARGAPRWRPCRWSPASRQSVSR